MTNPISRGAQSINITLAHPQSTMVINTLFTITFSLLKLPSYEYG
jgi:hypothetical protein